MKKLIEVEIKEIDLEDLNGMTFKEAAIYFKNYPESLSISFKDFKIKAEYDYGGLTLYVVGKREETTSEYESRLKLEEKDKIAAAKKLERERAKYEKLKKQFEN